MNKHFSWNFCALLFYILLLLLSHAIVYSLYHQEKYSYKKKMCYSFGSFSSSFYYVHFCCRCYCYFPFHAQAEKTLQIKKSTKSALNKTIKMQKKRFLIHKFKTELFFYYYSGALTNIIREGKSIY